MKNVDAFIAVLRSRSRADLVYKRSISVPLSMW
ncbi:hypothetical protein KCP77_06835 [Salmonella enterica subsp. enterica]|nr:hypothetical protein KCP77_06835 [Salmonella enterica subsp. enterica]